MKVLIAAGGTGGHIYPGISIATKIKKEHPEAIITFVGTDKGLEKDLIPKEGFPIEIIRVKGFRRKISFDTFKSIGKLFSGLFDAIHVIKKTNPDIVIGTGGYVCGPILFIASMYKIPTLIHEQNAFPGITNKILSRFVDCVAISFTESKSFFKNNKNIVLSGNPIREEFKDSNRMIARAKMNIPKEDFVISVSGGSQGALSINNSMVKVIDELKKYKDIRIIHITGKGQYENILRMLKEKNITINRYPKIQILPYSFEVANIYKASDLIISRAGAMTISEITAVGRPAILIPFPYATDNHQEFNARVISDMDGGILIKDKELNGDVLLETIKKLRNNKDRLNKMEESTRKLGILNGDDILYNEIINLLKSN